MKLGRIAGLAFLLGIVTLSPVWGQASRTWVSGVGDDANPCSRTAPCKTFAGAISKTAAGGEINTLDPGGFGGVTITKSISIINDFNGSAGVLVSGTNGIIVNAGANDIVVLRGLDIEGLSTGLNGIRFLGGKTLHIENCTIEGFRSASSGFGIAVETTSGTNEVFVKNTIIRNNGTGGTGGGMVIRPSAGSIRAVIENVHFDNNVVGLRAQDNSTATISNSGASGNSTAGFQSLSTSALVLINLVNVIAASNVGSGIESNGAAAAVRIDASTVTGNTVGLSRIGGGQILSFGTNNVSGNGTEGTPSSTVPKI